MSNFAKILEAAKKMKETSSGGSSDQEKFWKCETDKAGNGSAIIRFLSGKTSEDLPFTKLYNHGFKGPTGKWFIENCPTTIGEDCPVCGANSVLWNSGHEKDKEIVRDRKRKLGFIANILVVSDPANPDNEGRVFLFKFGKKIFDKVTDAMEPDNGDLKEDDEDFIKPINPFSSGEDGANFKLRIRRDKGFANYDKSEFTKPKEMDADWDEVKDQLHDLATFTDPSSFKPFDELERKMKQILSATQVPTSRRNGFDEEEDDDDKPVKEEKARVEKPKAEKPAKTETSDDDDMDYFRKLASDDE